MNPQPNAVQELLSRSIPSELWHYTTLHGFEGILASGRFWATDVRFLNDRTEFIHALKIAEDLVSEMPEHEVEDVWVKDKARQLLEGYVVGPLSPSRLEVYTVSFTVLEDTLSQWRGYGIDGVSLCFNLQNIRPPIGIGSLVSFAPCMYAEHEKRLLITSALHHFLSTVLRLYRATGDVGWATQRLREWQGLPPEERAARKSLNEWNEKLLRDEIHKAYVISAADLMRVAALCKDRSFHEEQEWRLMLPVERGRPLRSTTRSYRIRNDMQVPYITTALFGAAPRLPLMRVIVGPGGDAAARGEMVSATLRTAGYEIAAESSKIPIRSLENT